MTTLDPTAYSDGKITGFTKFGGGFDLGKSQANVPNRFVVWDTAYVNYFYTRTIWQTAISSRPNHFISASLHGQAWLIFNAASDGSSYNGIQTASNGDIYAINETGGTLITNVGALTNPYTLSIDASTFDHPLVKYNGTSVGAITLSAARTGSYVGIELDAGSDAGTIQIEPGGAPTAPGTPTGITAAAGDAQVSLTWTAPADGGSAITGYEVDWSSNGGSSWLGPTSTGSTATSYTKTSLSNGTVYVFRVRAINAVGTGSYSSTSSSVTPVLPGGRMQESASARLLESSNIRNLEGVFTAPPTLPFTDYGKYQTATSGPITLQLASPSVSVPASSLLVLLLMSSARNNFSTSPNVAWTVADTIADTGGGAWTRQARCQRSGSATSGQYMEQVEIWTRQIGTTPGASKVVTQTGTVTGGATPSTSDDGWVWANLLAIPLPAGSPIGATSGETTRAAAGPTTFTVTLGAAPNSTSIVFSIILADNSAVVSTAPSGFTQLREDHPTGGNVVTAFDHLSAPTTFQWTALDTASNYMAAGLEIKL